MVLAHRLQLGIGLCSGFLFACVVAESVPHIQFLPVLLAGCIAIVALVWPKALMRLIVISTIGFIIGVLLWQHAYKEWNTGLPAGEVPQIHGWVAALIIPRENNDRTIIEVLDAHQGETLMRSTGIVRLAVYGAMFTIARF